MFDKEQNLEELNKIMSAISDKHDALSDDNEETNNVCAKNSGIRSMIRILKDFATACYITNPNSHPALSEDRITWNKRKFIWRTSL